MQDMSPTAFGTALYALVEMFVITYNSCFC